ncbi:class I SAM-dependent methyltransferase [Actinoplanes sp. NPDC049265]|uniref:class I SAM-dependent methyltransferase n=1 Tax=Actinoplanes sp. NPDC049265 TaxID=3363902 RepID=UPI00371FA928
MSTEHYFSADPSTPGRPAEVTFAINGRDYRLASAGGVFSNGRLDGGTSVLLKKGALPTAATTGALLDLGCGWGPIACVLATEAPAAAVYAVDVNARARELTSANAERLELPITVAGPDDVPGDVTFAQIWSNPPTHAGKSELHAIMERWLPRLAPDGVAWLVINRHLGGDSLHTWLVDGGWAVERKASQKGFRVLRVTRKTD